MERPSQVYDDNYVTMDGQKWHWQKATVTYVFDKSQQN